MKKYVSPFVITNKMLELISSIMKKIGKLDNYNNLNKMPILRRNNRIKSIHSSLAIEANSLSLNQVKDVIDRRIVLGPKKEIQEVKNAYEAYSKIKSVNPYSIKDLKYLHGIMTHLTINESGGFRKGNEGVFDEKGNCIHIYPPPEQVDELMKQLFEWMKTNKKEIHPLILSSVFHYEFVFIHPFSDGNGRMARLWQTIILASWENLFEFLPIESQIMKYQNEYYYAINKCNLNGYSTEFIEFMLNMIDKVLEELINNIGKELTNSNIYVSKLMDVMEYGVKYQASELMQLLNLKSRASFRENYLMPAIDKKLIKMTYPDNPTNKNQTYYK